jgi:hypothetical protein
LTGMSIAGATDVPGRAMANDAIERTIEPGVI